MIQATVGTRKFEFTAFGDTEDSARAAMRAGLESHAQEYLTHADDGGKSWVEEVMGDVNFRSFVAGQCFRDYEAVSNLHPFDVDVSRAFMMESLDSFMSNERDKGAVDGLASTIAEGLYKSLKDGPFLLSALTGLQLAILTDVVAQEQSSRDLDAGLHGASADET